MEAISTRNNQGALSLTNTAYWNVAYTGEWKQKVGVTPPTLDPCIMTATCNQAKDAPHEIAAILVDSTLVTGNKQIATTEECMHSNYDM
jgi:hypothetical protein